MRRRFWFGYTPWVTPQTHIRQLLDDHGAPYVVVEHPTAATAAEAATARGTPLAMGGKSIVMKLDRGLGFVMLVTAGDRQVDNRLLRRHLGVRRYRFATPDELLEHTGLTPGCVPPFGRPVFDLALYVDAARATAPEIAFSLATHTASVRMATADWLAVARPTDVFPFAREP